jgi:hypothetical protein
MASSARPARRTLARNQKWGRADDQDIDDKGPCSRQRRYYHLCGTAFVSKVLDADVKQDTMGATSEATSCTPAVCRSYKSDTSIISRWLPSLSRAEESKCDVLLLTRSAALTKAMDFPTELLRRFLVVDLGGGLTSGCNRCCPYFNTLLNLSSSRFPACTAMLIASPRSCA